MPYITSVERIGIQKGLEQGLKQGLKQGLEQGLEQGRREELLAGIALALDLKFGDAGLTLLPEIQLISEVARLQAIRDRIKAAGTPEELRQVYVTPDAPT
jgi:flagellar biosynthesis/type III secretory pathway protein FliH